MTLEESLARINSNLWCYLNAEIFPQYAQNDAGHQLDHIQYVMRRSLHFADYAEKHDNSCQLNYNIIITAAAYHDLGHHLDPEKHEEISARILEDDRTIRNFLSPDEIKIAARAIRNHRSHFSNKDYNIYDKILVSADCNINIDAMLRRTYAYRVQNCPNSRLEEIIEDSRQHLIEKYAQKATRATKCSSPTQSSQKRYATRKL